MYRNKYNKGFLDGSNGEEEPACNAGDPGMIPGSGRSPEVGNGNPFQYSCPENSMDRGAWWAYGSWGCKEMETTELLALSNTGNIGRRVLHKNFRIIIYT